MRQDQQYWFAAKRYGWGWGLPLCWQGWAVLAVFVALLMAGSVFLSPATRPGAYLGFVALLSGALVGVCYWKGEPPKWRWGR